MPAEPDEVRRGRSIGPVAERAGHGEGRVDVPARPAPGDQQPHRSTSLVSTVSREIDSRMPTAARLMVSDEPPALMNGSVMPVTGMSATTTPMLMKAWMQSQAVIPAASSAPNVSGRRERDADPRVGQPDEQEDHDPRPDQPELLADDREDVVVAGVRQEQPAGQPALPEPGARGSRRARARAGPGSCGSRSRAGRTTGRARSGSGPSGSRAGRRARSPTRAANADRTRGGSGSPPATKNIVSPVRPMTIVVPRSGSLKTSATIGATMIRNGIVPAQKPADPAAALREPVGEIDDQRRASRTPPGGGPAGAAELQPAGRAADDDVQARDEDEDEQDAARRRSNGTDTNRR